VISHFVFAVGTFFQLHCLILQPKKAYAHPEAPSLRSKLREFSAYSKEMARVSRKYVIISEPNVFNLIIILGSLFIKHERGALKFSKRFVSNLITEAGLKIIKHTFIGGLVMPNGTPTFMLPYVNPVSRSFCSFFQIFISEKY